MIKDAHLNFSELQALTECNGASTNVIDMTKLGDAVAGAELYLVVRIGTAGDTSEETGTLNIAIQTDSAEAFNAAVVNLAEKDLTEAELTANTIVWKVKLPPGCKRYLRLYYTENGSAVFTAGTIDAFLTPDVDIT